MRADPCHRSLLRYGDTLRRVESIVFLPVQSTSYSAGCRFLFPLLPPLRIVRLQERPADRRRQFLPPDIFFVRRVADE